MPPFSQAGGGPPAQRPLAENLRQPSAKPSEPLTLRINAADFRPTLVEELKAVFEHFQGDTEVLLEMQTREGLRRLRFGSDYRVRLSSGLRAELDVLLGPGVLAA